MAAAAKRETRDQELKKEAKNTPDPSSIHFTIVTNIERGVWTASQMLEAFIAQALVAHSATNCITEVLFDYGRKRAKELDVEFEKTNQLKDPLHGVPISVKSSCNPLDAGAVPFVKTNVPQTMYSYHNPYNAAYSSGGSSGGEACMLSLDASVIGLGSDIAGSLRNPAAYCGIRGAQRAYNNLPPLPFRDVTLPKKLRFGYYTSGNLTRLVDGVMKASPACIRAVKETIKALGMAGHDYLTPQILSTHVALTAADEYKNLLKGIGSDPLVNLESYVLYNAEASPWLGQQPFSFDVWFEGSTYENCLQGKGKIKIVMGDIEDHALCLRCNELKREFCREFWQKHDFDGIITHVHTGLNMLSIMSASRLTYNLLDSPSGAIPVTHVKAAIDELMDEWINGPGHGSSMCESELDFEKKPLYNPTEMDEMPIGDEKVLAMMRVVDDALGKERGFSPGSWE
ncbi:amidase signature domain-containing protein [Mycena epipterygia]|nr:amidase signature domain-containing protein [Mycena epipterygia]